MMSRPRPHSGRPGLSDRVLRESGHGRDALRVLANSEELRRAREAHGKIARVLSFILKWTIGYGYYPQRAIWALGILILAGWLIYARAYAVRVIVPTDKEAWTALRSSQPSLVGNYPAFSPFIYSLENSLPLVKLGQADKWQPEREHRALLYFLRLQILLGWLLATFFVAGVSGVVHKE